MDKYQLQQDIIKELVQIGHPSPLPISKEILDYLSKTESITKDQIIGRLKKNEPWEYIRGWAEFRGLHVAVNNSVLIPRIETEGLVDLALDAIIKFLQKNQNITINIIDIGTGSGAIIISLWNELKKYSKNITFYATDISREALEIAKKNAQTYNATIAFINCDILPHKDKVDQLFEQKTFIISNPPYIPHRVYLSLDKSVKEYEPKLALDGGDDGCNVYRRIKDRLKDFSPSPSLFFEIDPAIRNFVKRIFPFCEFKKDQFGKIRYTYII